MEKYSIFDIIGPAMVGPSSSHTAGAAKVAYLARAIFGQPIDRVIFRLHGSFLQTGKGHGTDKALIAGILGLKHDDPQIKEAYDLLAATTIQVTFEEADLGEVHPNTVEIHFVAKDGSLQTVTGSSIGGGNVKIIAIDEVEVTITGKYSTIIVLHHDKPGLVAKISKILSDHQINIAYMKLFRESKGAEAVNVIETDELLDKTVLAKLRDVDGIYKLTYFEKVI